MKDLLLKQHRTAYLSLWLICVLVSVGAALACWTLYPPGLSAETNFAGVYLIILPLCIPIAVSFYFTQKMTHLMMQQIATSLGYTYATKGDFELHGALLTAGHSHSVYDVMDGTYNGLRLRIFSHTFIVGYGKSSHSYYETVLQLAYAQMLPRVVLIPRAIFGTGDVALSSDLEKVELEGDFNEKFNLYAEHAAQISVREILTPDVMQELMDQYQNARFELDGNTLTFVDMRLYKDRQQFLNMLALADKLIDRLLPGFRSAAEDVAVA